MTKRRIALAAILISVGGCDLQPASVQPTVSQLVGQYVSADGVREPGGTMDLYSDMTFTGKWVGVNGTGTWQVIQNSTSHAWEVRYSFSSPQITFQSPQSRTVCDCQVLGSPDDYRIGLFDGDPADGPIIFKRR